jgi:transposase
MIASKHYGISVHTVYKSIKSGRVTQGGKQFEFVGVSHNGDKIRCLTNGVIYDSKAEAERSLGLGNSSISKMFKTGKSSIKGLSFEMVKS